MYVEASNIIHTCKGNYSWITTTIDNPCSSKQLYLLHVGRNQQPFTLWILTKKLKYKKGNIFVGFQMDRDFIF
jgi:hypothetical protein